MQIYREELRSRPQVADRRCDSAQQRPAPKKRENRMSWPEVFSAISPGPALWPYLIMSPLYLIAMAVIAASERKIERRQEQLHQQGSALSVGQALSLLPVNS
jgi:hypothetical protein